MQRHLAIVADVVAIDRQAVGGAVAGTGHINQAAVIEGSQLASSEGADGALVDQQHTAAIDIQGAGTGACVAEFEFPGQGKTRAIVQVDLFPVGVALGVGCFGFVKRQGIGAQAAIDQGRRGEGGLRQVLQECGVVIRAHIDCRVDRAGADPVELIVAEAHEHLAVDHAARQGKQIIAAADTDVTADIPPGNADGVQAKPGHQVTNDLPAQQGVEVVVELHVDPPDRARRLGGDIAIFERSDDLAATHIERIPTVALGQTGDTTATLRVGIDAITLVNRTNAAAADLDAIGAVALGHRPHDSIQLHTENICPIAHVQRAHAARLGLHQIVAVAKCHSAGDCTIATGRQVEGVVAIEVGKAGRGAAVAGGGVVAGRDHRGTSRVGR